MARTMLHVPIQRCDRRTEGIHAFRGRVWWYREGAEPVLQPEGVASCHGEPDYGIRCGHHDRDL
jgi:hypothetical protein